MSTQTVREVPGSGEGRAWGFGIPDPVTGPFFPTNEFPSGIMLGSRGK